MLVTKVYLKSPLNIEMHFSVISILPTYISLLLLRYYELLSFVKLQLRWLGYTLRTLYLYVRI